MSMQTTLKRFLDKGISFSCLIHRIPATESNMQILMSSGDQLSLGLMAGKAVEIKDIRSNGTGWYTRELTKNWQTPDALLLFCPKQSKIFIVKSEKRKNEVNAYIQAFAIDYSVKQMSIAA